MLGLFGLEANGVLYELLLWPLVRLSDSAELMRAPAVIAGVAAVPATWWAGRELLSERAGLIAAGLLAVNPFALWYAQEARAYSLVVLFAALSFPLLKRALQDARPRWGVLYVLVTAAAAYSNMVALLVLLPAHAVLVAPGGMEAIRRWLRQLAGLALALMPLLYLLVHARLERDTLYYLAAPGPRDLVRIVREYLAGYTTTGAIYAAGLGVVAIVVVWAVVRVRRELPRSASDALGRPLAPVVAWALLAPALVFVLSQAMPLFESHFLIAALPGAMLLLAACILALPRAAAAAAVVALAAVMLGGDRWTATTSMKEQWRSALTVLERRPPNETMLLDNSFSLPALGYIYPPARDRSGDLLVKEWEDRPLPPWLVLRRDPGGYDDSPAGPPTPALIALLARRQRLWIVLAEAIDGPQGDVSRGRALNWARRNCRVREHRWSLPGREYQDVFVATVERCRLRHRGRPAPTIDSAPALHLDLAGVGQADATVSSAPLRAGARVHARVRPVPPRQHHHH